MFVSSYWSKKKLFRMSFEMSYLCESEYMSVAWVRNKIMKYGKIRILLVVLSLCEFKCVFGGSVNLMSNTKKMKRAKIRCLVVVLSLCEFKYVWVAWVKYKKMKSRKISCEKKCLRSCFERDFVTSFLLFYFKFFSHYK